MNEIPTPFKLTIADRHISYDMGVELAGIEVVYRKRDFHEIVELLERHIKGLKKTTLRQCAAKAMGFNSENHLISKLPVAFSHACYVNDLPDIINEKIRYPVRKTSFIAAHYDERDLVPLMTHHEAAMSADNLLAGDRPNGDIKALTTQLWTLQDAGQLTDQKLRHVVTTWSASAVRQAIESGQLLREMVSSYGYSGSKVTEFDANLVNELARAYVLGAAWRLLRWNIPETSNKRDREASPTPPDKEIPLWKAMGKNAAQLDYYWELTRGGEYQVKLNKWEAAAALKAYDYGAEELKTDEEKHALRTLIGKLKFEIWP